MADFFSRNEDGNLQPSFGSSMESDAGTGLGAALSAVSKRIERLEPALAAHMDDIGGKHYCQSLRMRLSYFGGSWTSVLCSPMVDDATRSRRRFANASADLGLSFGVHFSTSNACCAFSSLYRLLIGSLRRYSNLTKGEVAKSRLCVAYQLSECG